MGTYYYIVCHDCKVEQPAASTSGENSPGGLGNSDTHLRPFIVEHAGHRTECVSEHHDGANLDYAEYEVKPEWRKRVEGVEAQPDPAMIESLGKYGFERADEIQARVLQGGPIFDSP